MPRFISLDGTDVEAKRQQLLGYFVSTWEQYEALFAALKDEALYARAESLRHPLIFYFGHTATFYVNKMILAQFTDARVDSELEAMFAIGVDEMSWDDWIPRTMTGQQGQSPKPTATRLRRESVPSSNPCRSHCLSPSNARHG